MTKTGGKNPDEVDARVDGVEEDGEGGIHRRISALVNAVERPVPRWQTGLLRQNGKPIEAVTSNYLIETLLEFMKPMNRLELIADFNANRKKEIDLFGQMAKELGCTLEDLNGTLVFVPDVVTSEEDPNFILQYGKLFQLRTLNYSYPNESRLNNEFFVVSCVTVGRWGGVMSQGSLNKQIAKWMDSSPNGNTIVLPPADHPEFEKLRGELNGYLLALVKGEGE